MNKFGIQHQSGSPADVGRIDYTRLATVKLLGNALNIGFARDIRAKAPNALLVLRAAGGDQDYAKAASIYADYACRLLDPFLSAGLCDVAEPLNEPVIRNDIEAMQLNAWQVDYATIMHARGYKVGAYNFSVGNPEFALWPFLHAGLRASDWLMLHEYGAPRMDSDAAFTSLRHRGVYASLPADCRKALLITECGIDLWTGGYAPGGGGYQRVTNCADYVGQLKAWLAELDKDDYVKGVHLFGYGLEAPWDAMGFDPASNESDRATFLSFIGGLDPMTQKITNDTGGAVEPPDPPQPEPHPEGPMDKQLFVNTTPAFVKAAFVHKLGAPLWPDERRWNDNGMVMVARDFQNGTLVTEDGKWALGDLLLLNPTTGEPISAPVQPPDNTTPPPPDQTQPQALTAIGANVVRKTVQPGKRFFRLNGVTVRRGISAFMVVTVIGKGAPAVDVKVCNLFPDGNGEVIATDGSGNARFQFAASSAFTDPGTGPFTVFMADDGAFKDYDSTPKRIVYTDQLSDIVRSLGDFRGEHTEIYLQFVEL